MFRRSFRRSFRRIQAGSIPPALQQANRLMASGQYDQAAVIFEQFASGALNRNGPRAPWFFLQAGQARLLAGQAAQGVAHIRQGLGLLGGRGQFQRMYHTGMRFITDLKARGMTSEAQQIQDFLSASLPEEFESAPVPGHEKMEPVLPTACPGCGGPIRSDEVEWIDALTAECPYCGSAVRAQA